jgi:RNA polymerase sigma-70 factor (ECF subfamily)
LSVTELHARPTEPEPSDDAVELESRSPEQLYRALAPAVFGYMRAQRAPDPEDLTGEVFVQVVRDLHRFRGDDARLRSWVFTIAHHRVVDARRRAARRSVAVSLDDADGAASYDAHPVDEFMDPELVRALDHLQRDVVVLRFVADLSLEQVARLVRRSTGAVKALQHRALARLAVEIQR